MRKHRERGRHAQPQPQPAPAPQAPPAAQRNQPAWAGQTVHAGPPPGTTVLAGRIRTQPQASRAVTGSAASPGGTPQAMPLAQVMVSPVSADYSTLAYRGVQPLWTTDGAAVPATAPGRWGQLYAAGRP